MYKIVVPMFLLFPAVSVLLAIINYKLAPYLARLKLELELILAAILASHIT